jgi:hypothetical protein
LHRRLGKVPIARSQHQVPVKVSIRFGPRVKIINVESVLHPVNRVIQGGKIFGVCMFGCQLRGSALQRAEQVINLGHISGGDTNDPDAMTGHDLQESGRLEPDARLADRGSAHAKSLCQLTLQKLLMGLELCVHDVPFEQHKGLIGSAPSALRPSGRAHESPLVRLTK